LTPPAELTTELVEVFRGAPELVAMGADREALDRIRRLDAEVGRLERRDAVLRGLAEGGAVLVAGLTVVGVLAVAASASVHGDLDRVLVAALALAALASFEAVVSLPSAAITLRSTLGSGRRLLEIAGREPTVVDPPHPAAPPDTSTLELDQASFDRGDEESWGLRAIDLRLPPGRRVAIVGGSGAGKSTLAELLVRFADPDVGQVRLGGGDVRGLRQRDVRATVTLDAQDAHIFSTSILENVRLARPDATDGEIRRAMGKARIEDWVDSLPDGWETFVGEGGSFVSGGERRRIALARAFLAGSPVIVLDEPTAHLDPSNAEAVVADALAGADGRSVVLITHGSEGLDAVDEIVTLRRGRIVSAGVGSISQDDEREMSMEDTT
jgi:ATP-binding cassette subfamily C protein CydC